MAKRRTPKRPPVGDVPRPNPEGRLGVEELIERARRTGTTGRTLVTIHPGAARTVLSALRRRIGVKILSPRAARSQPLAGRDRPDCLLQRFSGLGVQLAVLDTGLDLRHPDFQDGRVAQTKDLSHLAANSTPGR
jgi:hypothetical protein